MKYNFTLYNVFQQRDIRDELELDGPDVGGVEDVRPGEVHYQEAGSGRREALLAHLLQVPQRQIVIRHFNNRFENA